jgi:predicted ATP-grasp superfamily ATP-dependent carboligase
VRIVQDGRELREAYRLMESPQAPNVMLQEYVPAGPRAGWMLNGYFDAASECATLFTGVKLRTSPPYAGATTLGVCLSNPPLEETTRRFMKAVGYRGILDIGYRLDSRDGLYKLLDVNPRIGATFRLFVGAGGVDVLRALYLDLTGQGVPSATPPLGRRWIVEPLDPVSSLAYARRGDLTLAAWARSLRGVREGAWFAADDPLPFLALWPTLLGDRLSRRLRSRPARRPRPPAS